MLYLGAIKVIRAHLGHAESAREQDPGKYTYTVEVLKQLADLVRAEFWVTHRELLN